MNFKFQTILTGRGLFVLIGSFALFMPGYFSSDIIASVLSVVILLLLGLSSMCVFLYGKYVEKKISFKVTYEQNKEMVRSGCIVLTLDPIFIPPMFSIRVTAESQKHGIHIETAEVSGKIVKPELIPLSLVTHHRGVWTIEVLKFEISDPLSFSSYVLIREVCLTLEITPPLQELSPMELFAGTLSEGDASPSPKARHGDEYDLKPYNPSDGMKKIAWKVFARKGELISRFPEDTSTPDGSTWVYVAAKTLEDEVVTHALEYIRQAEEKNLQIQVGFLGTTERVHSFEAATELAIDSAWSAEDAVLETSLKSFLSCCEQEMHTLVVFINMNQVALIQKIRDSIPPELSVVFYGSFASNMTNPSSLGFINLLIKRDYPERVPGSFTFKDKDEILHNFLKVTEGCEVFVNN